MFSKLRISSAETFVFHAFLSLLIGGLASGLTAAGAAIAQTGINFSIIVSAGVAAFLAWFVHGFIALRNNPQFGQAEKDVSAQLATLTGNHQALVDQVAALYQQVAQSPQAAQLAAMVTEAVTQRVQAALPSLIATTTPQPVPSYSSQQVPFPIPTIANMTAGTYSTPNITTSPQQPSISFGDTGNVPKV